MSTNLHIEQAVKIAGSQAELARRSRLSQPAIHKLLHGKCVPSAETAVAIEMATDGAVRRSDLRPDLYPVAEDEPETA